MIRENDRIPNRSLNVLKFCLHMLTNICYFEIFLRKISDFLITLGFITSNIYMDEVSSKEMRGTFITLGSVCR